MNNHQLKMIVTNGAPWSFTAMTKKCRNDENIFMFNITTLFEIFQMKFFRIIDPIR